MVRCMNDLIIEPTDNLHCIIPCLDFLIAGATSLRFLSRCQDAGGYETTRIFPCNSCPSFTFCALCDAKSYHSCSGPGLQNHSNYIFNTYMSRYFDNHPDIIYILMSHLTLSKGYFLTNPSFPLYDSIQYFPLYLNQLTLYLNQLLFSFRSSIPLIW